MKRKATICLLVIFATIQIHSQITITQQDVENILEPGKTWTSYSNTEVNGSVTMDIGITSNSISQNWLEPTVIYPDTTILINMTPASTSYQAYFPSATHSQKSTSTSEGYTIDNYSFLQVTANNVRDLGYLLHVYGNGIDTIYELEQIDELSLELPLSLGSSFETYYDSSDGGFGIYNVEQVINTYDAYGDISFFGNNIQALRLNKETAHRVYDNGSLINTWYQREYEWITKTNGFLEIDADTSTILSGNVPIQEIVVTLISGSTDVKENINEINSFSLKQNYPNPFNPSTTLSFVIGQSSFVSLKIYDVLGNEVATLVNEEKMAGIHSINFNALNLSSGIYFYRLNAENFSETKSMLLIK